jgi:hypothetical protein
MKNLFLLWLESGHGFMMEEGWRYLKKSEAIENHAYTF